MTLKYEGEFCLVATMHKKETVIGPAFESFLGCKVVEAKINTDLLGTFSGEIERKLPPLQCAKEKCYRALAMENIHLAVANEGSFGPHPFIPFAAAGHELLFFTDTRLKYDLFLSKVTLNTNYNGKCISDIEELLLFAKEALFPSHGLIVRPHLSENTAQIFKGIQEYDDLKRAFTECSKISSNGKAWVETDMRAHMNPTRMAAISELAQEMAARLATSCPACQIPGWGLIKTEGGLECEVCGSATELVQSEVYGCCKCSYQEVLFLNRGKADPAFCPFCNP